MLLLQRHVYLQKNDLHLPGVVDVAGTGAEVMVTEEADIIHGLMRKVRTEVMKRGSTGR